MQDSGHTPEWTGPKVERLMRNGKRVYVSAFKAWLVEQAQRPGVSVAGLALRNEVNANQLRQWMRLGHWGGSTGLSPSAPVMLPVTLVDESNARAPASRPSPARVPIEIELGGALVRVHCGVDAQTLRLVLAALRP